MNITKGKIQKAQRVTIYGPEGIGKSTIASQFPNPVFIDIEGGTEHLDVARTDRPLSWSALLGQIKELMHMEFRSIVIDTADWAERLCTEHVCQNAGKQSLGDFAHGRGYVFLQEEYGRFLNLLNDVREKGIHVVLLAHASIRKFEQPDEMGAYDRWELKLSKKAAPLTKEWSDMLLFANYETFVVEDDKTKSKKVQGGRRVMHTSHNPAWDAKNRHDLDPKLDFNFGAIAHCLKLDSAPENTDHASHSGNLNKIQEESVSSEVEQMNQHKENEKNLVPHGHPELPEARKPTGDEVGAVKEEPDAPEPPAPELGDANEFDIDKEWGPSLRELCEESGVSASQIRQMAFKRGVCPLDTPIDNMPDNFIGTVIANWHDKVIPYLKELEFEAIN